MAVFDRVAIDQWGRDELVQKFPKGGLGDIKLGSQCIVNPYETAVFVREGDVVGVLDSGRHTLTTENIPFLTNLLERGLFGGKNVFTADVYYVKTSDQTLRWGTQQPVLVEHPQRPPGASAMIGNGTYVVRVTDAPRFLIAMDAYRDSVREPDLKDRLDPKLGVMLQDKLSELAQAKSLGPAELQSFSLDLNQLLLGLLQTEFDSLGMSLVDFNIRMNMHPDSLAVVTKMGYGTSYTQMQSADAMVDAANNPSGGGLAELGIGMMGINALQNAQGGAQAQAQAQQPVQQAAQTVGSAIPAQPAIPDVMNPQQAAEILQVSVEDVQAAIDAGDLKARKIGNAVRISRKNLEVFLDG